MIIVSYDISDDKVRSQFHRFLKKHGRSLQYSVFEINHSERVLNLILLEIEKKFKKRFVDSDSILIFGVCEWCRKKVVRYGYAIQEQDTVVFM